MKTLIWLWGFAEYNSYCLRAAAGDVARTIVVSDFLLGVLNELCVVTEHKLNSILALPTR